MKIIDPTQINQDAEVASFISTLLYDSHLASIVLFPQNKEIVRTDNDGMQTSFQLKYTLIRRQFAHKRGYCYEVLNDDQSAVRQTGGFGQVHKSLGKIVFLYDGQLRFLPSPHIVKSQTNAEVSNNEYFIGSQLAYLEAKPLTQVSPLSIFGHMGTQRDYSFLRCLGKEIEDARIEATKLDEFMFLAIGIANAVRELHGLNIVHGDIKPANLVKKNGVIRLIDLGGSKMHGASKITFCTTPDYMAPELFSLPDITLRVIYMH